MLQPLLFEQGVVDAWGKREKHRGFVVLRNSLFLTCAQDIAKITCDEDPRTPSIRNLMLGLSDEKVRAALRDRFKQWRIPVADSEVEDTELIEAFRRLEQVEEAERSAQFESLYAEALIAWASLSSDPAITAFRTVRDKVTAHSELKYHVDKYQPMDIGTLGIRWGDLRMCMERMQRLIEIIGMIVRTSSFAWDSLDEQLSRSARNFWALPIGTAGK